MFKKTKEEIQFIYDNIKLAHKNTKDRLKKIENDNKSQHGNIFRELRKEMDEKINKLPALPELVECDVCGCLLKKETAIRGESRIKEPIIIPLINGGSMQIGEERIEEVYYCKCHAPKTKKSKK